MKNRFTSVLAFLMILFVSSNTSLFAEIVTTIEGGEGLTGDDIFKTEKVEKGDFYTIKVEPKKDEIKKGISSTLESVKQKKLAQMKRLEAERKKVEAAKNEIKDNKAKMKSDLEKKKAAMKGEKTSSSKKETNTKSNTESNTAVNNSKSETAPVKTIEQAEKDMTKNIKLREKFVNCGMDLQGISYVWGGKTPNPGFDCSGLVTYAAKKSVGVDLSGNAQDIYNKVTPIALSEAVPGDLVFFKGRFDSRVTHVGIYLGNDSGTNDFGNQNVFLNSASGGPRTGVIVSGMNENYWNRNYYGCGRFLDPME